MAFGERSALVVVRHGDTTYSNEFPDLTVRGRAQMVDSGRVLRWYIEQFRDNRRFVSSPAVRAQGSMLYLQQGLGMESDYDRVETNELLRPLETKDLAAFKAFDKEHSTENYGEMWFKHPYLRVENPITEAGESVDQRAAEFLRQQTDLLKVSTKPTVLVATTHFEILANYMKGLCSELPTYPIETMEAPKNAEALIMEIESAKEYAYTLYGRGQIQRVGYNPETGCFSLR